MPPSVRAKLKFKDPRSQPRGSYFTMPSRLASEPKGRPGQWSIVVEFSEEYEVVNARFLSDHAPHAELKSGAVVELWEGPKLIGKLTVLG